jgi:signal transduction histidine kinase/DNA-binding response OmpR family regulator
VTKTNPFIFRVILLIGILTQCSNIIGQKAINVNYFNELQDEYIIDENLYILEDSGCLLDFDNSILDSSTLNFKAYDESKELTSKSCHWIHFKIKSSESFNHYFKDWKLSIGDAEFASIYIVDHFGEIVTHKKFGKWYPNSKKDNELNFREQRVNLSFDPSEGLSFYIKYQKVNNHRHRIDIRFNKYDLFQSYSYVFKTWQDWLFLGFLLTMILLNFLFYFSTRYNAYFFHGLFILGLSIFLLDMYEVTLNLPLIENYPFMVQFVDMLGIGIADLAYFQFVRHYLNLNQILPFWDKVLKNIVLLKVIFWPLAIAFFYITFNESLTDKLILVFLVLEYSIIVYFLIFKLRPKEKAILYLIIGSSFLVILLLIDTLSLLNNIGISKTLSQVGIMGEIIAFSFGLSYRFQTLQEEESKANKIRELSEFKAQLLTNITHEFRTPLTIIQGVSELFQDSLDNKIKPKDIKEGYDAIERNCRSLLILVNQMLDLAKLESKTIKLDLSQQDLVLVIKSVINSLSSGAKKKNISLVFESTSSSIELEIDEQKIITVLINLISNAIKFTPKFGNVKVTLDTKQIEGKTIDLIQISDTGIGISKENLPNIFERFFQTKTNKANIVGTGIGLSLVKELIDLMNGSINVSSKLNKGTVFTIELPRVKNNHITSNSTQNEDVSSVVKERNTFDLANQKPVLLIVEDNQDIVDYLDRLLRDKYKLEKAYDGLEGLEKAYSIIPDLIISDLMMPKLDGIKLCEKLKSDEKTNHIPIIILTAKTAFEHKIEGLKTGADAYLVKPFRKEELFIRLKKLNESRVILQKKFSQFSLIEKPKELKKENSFLHKIHSVIEENINNDQFNVEELANLMHMSRMQLHRKIKAVSDRTSSNYIRSYRLHKSKPQLSDVNLNISEVAWSVGFKDVNYYSKSFQKEFKISPSEYRAKIRIQ